MSTRAATVAAAATAVVPWDPHQDTRRRLISGSAAIRIVKPTRRSAVPGFVHGVGMRGVRAALLGVFYTSSTKEGVLTRVGRRRSDGVDATR